MGYVWEVYTDMTCMNANVHVAAPYPRYNAADRDRNRTCLPRTQGTDAHGLSGDRSGNRAHAKHARDRSEHCTDTATEAG